MYPGRGVLHTPPERFRRKRRGVPMHKNDHSPPPAAFVRRMLLRPYTIGKSEIKKQGRMRYPCMCVLHTPHKYSIKEYSTLHKYTSSPPPAVLVGRMQYAPTVLQEWNLKNENAPTLPENLRSKKQEQKTRIHDSTCTRICF